MCQHDSIFIRSNWLSLFDEDEGSKWSVHSPTTTQMLSVHTVAYLYIHDKHWSLAINKCLLNLLNISALWTLEMLTVCTLDLNLKFIVLLHCNSVKSSLFFSFKKYGRVGWSIIFMNIFKRQQLMCATVVAASRDIFLAELLHSPNLLLSLL